MKLTNVIVVGLVVSSVGGLLITPWAVAQVYPAPPGIPCPQTTTQASTPCPLPGELDASCNVANCDWAITDWSADSKNTGSKDNKPAETYAHALPHTTPGYKCATAAICQLNSATQKCSPVSYEITNAGYLYTKYDCD